ncbi:hypothetical protein [Thalassolituus oleivorans]|uniref:Uncharacterized protein n=2 Tax=root TaxID=1 RepID=M5DQ49_9GAMM|nr:hypothetical protein [Thalassolituus oleivorans]CCU71302.1 hypothetical protein TOL_0866 [Thalassolituus oleivorans MIL-1]
MSADDWEEFIEEWMSHKSSDYYDFERLGGAGDVVGSLLALL